MHPRREKIQNGCSSEMTTRFCEKIYLPRHFYKKKTHIYSLLNIFITQFGISSYTFQTNRSIKMQSNKEELMQKVELMQKMEFC